MNRLELARLGEKACVKKLREKGYKILETNYRCSLGEVDIICCKKDLIVFVEVKTRTTNIFGFPQESVNFIKQKKIKRIACYYLKRNNLFSQGCRFDVMSVIYNENKTMDIEHFENAF